MKPISLKCRDSIALDFQGARNRTFLLLLYISDGICSFKMIGSGHVNPVTDDVFLFRFEVRSWFRHGSCKNTIRCTSIIRNSSNIELAVKTENVIISLD